jgi:hypothetical protein
VFTPPIVPPPIYPPKKSNKLLMVLLAVGVVILAGLIVSIVILLTPKPMAKPSVVTEPKYAYDSQFDASKYSTEPCEYTDLWPQYDGNKIRNYCRAELETWPQYKAVYEGVCDALCPSRMNKDKDDKTTAYIKEKFNLDTSVDADYQYFVAMSLILSREYSLISKGMLDDPYKAMYTNGDEIKADNVELAKRLEETWNRFLAHENLDYTFDITFDGKPFKYDGKYAGKNKGVKNYKQIAEPTTDESGETIEQPVPTQVPESGDTDVVTLETWSKSYNPTSPGSDGSYRDAIKTYVDKFGMELDYEFSHIYAGCYMSQGQDVVLIEAAYCHATPNKIFINSGFVYYDKNLKTSAIVDAVKHEMAHHLIGVTCGTSVPSIMRTSLPEAITSSYAVLFLGANREYLNSSTPEEYWMTDETDRIARLIHDDKKCF